MQQLFAKMTTRIQEDGRSGKPVSSLVRAGAWDVPDDATNFRSLNTSRSATVSCQYSTNLLFVQ